MNHLGCGQGLLKIPGSFWVLMLKYAFSHILETLFLSFLTAGSITNTDKNSTSYCTSIKPVSRFCDLEKCANLEK